jgi:hypothetical protein
MMDWQDHKLDVARALFLSMWLALAVPSGAAAPGPTPVQAGEDNEVPSMPARPSKPAVTGGRPAMRTEKPGAPVAMAWRLEGPPAVGQRVGVTLDFTALSALSGRVRLAATPGLALPGVKQFELPSRARGEHWTQRVEVIALDPSPQYLHVVVSTTGARGQRLMRGFAVPVALNQAAARKSDGVLKKGAAGDQVVSLTASEEVIRPPSR